MKNLDLLFNVTHEMRRAASSAEAGNFDGALAAIRRIYALYDSEGPTSKARVQINVMAADYAHRARDPLLSYKACKVALEQLSIMKGGLLYSNSDIAYLRYYCRVILADIADVVGLDAVELSNAVEVQFSDLDYKRVGGRIRRRFPISFSRGAEYDAYIAAKSGLR